MGEWMGSAGDRLQTWRELHGTETAQEPGHLRTQLGQLLELSKEAEAISSLHVSVSHSGAQLLQLKDEDVSGLRAQLEQLEQRWAGTRAAQQDVQQRLHKLLMEKLSLEEVMEELNLWMGKVESRLTEDELRVHQASSTASLGPLLQHCQEYKVEMALHQLSLDFVSQAVVQTSGLEDIQEKRYERTSLAERLGALHLRWLTLQGALASQAHRVERLQQICADRESRLLALCRWVSGRRGRMEELQRPSSLSQAQRAVKECEDMELKLKMKSVDLQELQDSCRSGEGGGEQAAASDCAFIVQMDSVRQDLTALSQQISTVRPALLWVVGQWEQFEGALGEAVLRTVRTSHALELTRIPQLSLHALQSHIQRLQLLQEEARGNEEAWEALRRSCSSLGGSVSPEAALLLSQRLEEERTRWAAVIWEVTEELRKAQALKDPWQAYARLSKDCLLQLRQRQDQWGALMSDPPCQGDAVELVRAQIEALSELQPSMEALQGTLKAVLEISKELIGQMEPQASLFIQSETQMLSQGVARLDGALALRLRQLQEELDLLQEFHRRLQFLEQHLRDFESRLTRTSSQDHNPKALQTDLLQLTALTSDLDALNQLGRTVVLSDGTARRLRDLGAQWALASSDAMATCCELQAGALWRQSLQQKCESWRCFLQSVEENLPKENVLGHSPDPLPRQLTAHREFQIRVSIGSQILNSVIVEALDLLDRSEVEDRYGLIRKLAQQTGRWQGTVERAWQRGALLQGLMGQQQVYAHGLRTLRRLLSDTDHLLSPTGGPAHYSLHQLHQSLQEHKHAEKQFWQHQGLYLRTLEAGGALVSAGATAMQAQLQDELRALREAWERAQGILRERRILTEAVLQNWECCQTRLADSRHRLEELKDRLKQPLPELLEELQITEQLTKEDEKSLEEWHHGLAQPANERVELVRHISPDDMALLQEREEGLRSQWEELCLKVSLCKQETADRLDTWTVFKEKKKQLCNWLTRFESEVAHSGHLTAEETAERLNKDYMEELNFFSENKTHLKQLGERLIVAGDRAREAVVKDMLKDVDDQWQHTTGCVESRMKQLQQRQDRVHELHRTVSGLRTQLSRTEANLATPLLYSECHSREIQRRLAEQQGLEQDVEQQSEGIAAVQALCDLLARDADDVETASMRESTLSLDRRLRNIRTLTAQRKSRINETQRLWREFLDDHEHFKDWLRTAEQTAAHPDSGPILYTAAKEEVKKFEALQREVQERLAPLELLNVRYRRLARENRTDTDGSLKVTVHEGNQRWDALQQRTTAILRRLKASDGWPELSVQASSHLLTLAQEQSGGEIQDAGGFPSREGELEATACASASGTSVTEPSPWTSPEPQETITQGVIPGLGASPTQTPRKQGYAELVSECSGSIDHVKRVSLILDDVEEPAVEQGLPGLAVADKQSGVIQRWEVLQAMSPQCRVPHDPPQPTSDLSDIIAWLGWALPELEQLQGLEPTASVHDMETSVNRLKAMQRTFDTYKGAVIALNLSRPEPQQGAEGGADAEGLRDMNQAWVKACALLEQWEERLRSALLRCQEFHQTLQSLLLWVASAESQRLAVNVQDPALGPDALREHGNTLTGLERELQAKQQQVGTLQEISAQLLRKGGAGEEDSDEPQEKLHVISHKLQLLLHEVAQDQRVIQERLEQEGETAAVGQPAENRRPERRDRSPPRSFFHRVLRAAFPLHLLLLLLLTLACLVPAWEEDYRCTQSNNFGRSLYPMLHYTNGPPPT